MPSSCGAPRTVVNDHYDDQLSRELVLRWDEDPSCMNIWQSLTPHRQQCIIERHIESLSTADTENFMEATRFLVQILPILPPTAKRKYRGKRTNTKMVT